MRIWTCGGEIVSAPESYVAHMWRSSDPKTKAKYKVGAGDAIKNRARAVKAHLGKWYDKTLTFPSFKEWRGKELDTSSITDGFKDLDCEDFEWYLNRFKHIYKDAGVLPEEVFQIEAIITSDDNDDEEEEESPLCLELAKMHWTNFGVADEIKLKKCSTSSGSSANEEARSIWWHKSSRLKDGSCCGSLRAWNTDQCIDGRNPKKEVKKLESYTCNLDAGQEAILQPSVEDEGEYLLTIGRADSHLCVSIDQDSLKVVECQEDTKWRKRNGFTPIEFELLSDKTKSEWKTAR